MKGGALHVIFSDRKQLHSTGTRKNSDHLGRHPLRAGVALL